MALQLKFEVSGNASKETKKLNAELKDLDKVVKTSGKAQKDYNTSLLKTAGAFVTIAGVIKIASVAYNSIIKTGLAYNKIIEEQTASIATLIAVTSANEDSLGNLLTTQEKYTLATQESVEVLKELEKINANTPNTLGETAKIFKTLLPSMKAVGATSEDLITLTEKLSIAANAGGVQFQSLLAGVDGLATGTVLANSDLGRFLSSIGLTNKALKGTDDVVGLLQDSLGQFTALDTLQVATSNLNVEWEKLTGTLTEDLFLTQKDSIKELTKLLKEVNGNSAQIQALQNTIASIGKSVINLASTLLRFGNSTRIMFHDIERGIDNVFAFTAIGVRTLQLEFFEFSNSIRESIESIIPPDIADLLGIDLLEDAKDRAADMEIIKEQIVLAGEAIVQNNEEFEKFRNEALLVNDIILETEKVLTQQLVAEKDITAEKEKQTQAAGVLVASVNKDKEALDDFFAGAKKGYKEFAKDAGGAAKTGEVAFNSFANNSVDGILKFAETGKLSFKDFAGSVISDIARIIIQQQIAGIAGNIISGFSASTASVGSSTSTLGEFNLATRQANGGAWQGGVQKFAKGGAFTNSIVDTPTTFPMANGTGLMGEAGAEAIIPLDRDSSGKLGVNASGLGGGNNVSIIVQNNTSQEISAEQISELTTTNERGQQETQILIMMNNVSRNVGGSRDFFKGLR